LDDSSNAVISFQKATYSFDFEQGGQLEVGNHGIFEINSLDNEISAGTITDFNFDENGLAKGYKGKIVHVFNKDESQVKTHPTLKEFQKEKTMWYLNKDFWVN